MKDTPIEDWRGNWGNPPKPNYTNLLIFKALFKERRLFSASMSEKKDADIHVTC